MKVELFAPFRSFLLQAPLYTSALVIMQEWQDPTLTMRVKDLALFREGYRARVGFRVWQHPYGTWVVAIPFSLDAPGRFRIQGMPCLNPRRATDYAVMRRFSREEYIRFLFLSADLEEAEDGQIPWTVEQRTQVRQLIQTIDQSLIGEKVTSVFDQDFEEARQEFEQLYAMRDVMTQEERW